MLLEATFTLIRDVEPGFVLWIVTVEKKAGLVGGAEQRFGHDWAAESVNDRARLQCSTTDLQVIVDCFCGEVQKLEMDAWERKKQYGAWRYTNKVAWKILALSLINRAHQNQKQTEKQERSATHRENRFSNKLKENTCFKLYSKVDSVSYQSRQVSSPSMCSLIHWGSCRGNQGLESLHLHLS